nr:hypothetical protein [Parachlamydiaceae bacterium]
MEPAKLLFDRCIDMPVCKRPQALNSWITKYTNCKNFDAEFSDIKPENISVVLGENLFVAYFNIALEAHNYTLATHI